MGRARLERGTRVEGARWVPGMAADVAGSREGRALSTPHGNLAHRRGARAVAHRRRATVSRRYAVATCRTWPRTWQEAVRDVRCRHPMGIWHTAPARGGPHASGSGTPPRRAPGLMPRAVARRRPHAGGPSHTRSPLAGHGLAPVRRRTPPARQRAPCRRAVARHRDAGRSRHLAARPFPARIRPRSARRRPRSQRQAPRRAPRACPTDYPVPVIATRPWCPCRSPGAR